MIKPYPAEHSFVGQFQTIDIAMDTNIYPNNGLGGIKLGQSIYEVLRILNVEESGERIEFKFNKELKMIIIDIVNEGIHLMFDRYLQRLFLIEIELDEISGESINLNYEYKNEIIKKFNFKLIYNKYFGPTYKGYYDSSKSIYYLSYFGITFKFKNIRNSEHEHGHDRDDSHLNEYLNTVNLSFNCSSIFIYQQNTTEKNSNKFLWDSYVGTICNLISNEPSIDYINKINLFNPIGNGNGGGGGGGTEDCKIKINYIVYSKFPNSIEFKFLKHPLGISSYEIRFGKTSMQDIVKIFGFPENSILKRKSRLNSIQMKKFTDVNYDNQEFEFSTNREYLPSSKINKFPNLKYIIPKPSSLTYLNQEIIKIHNYFIFGFDLIYDLNVCENGSNLISRMIIHENCIGSTEFLKYEKLPFFYKDDVDGDDKYLPINTMNDLNNVLCLELTGLPIFLDKKEYNIQEDFEIKLKNKDKNKFKETDRSFEIVEVDQDVNGVHNNMDGGTNNDLNYWGLSNFDCCENLIFETLNSTDEICTITIHE